MAGLEVLVAGIRQRGFLGFWNRVETCRNGGACGGAEALPGRGGGDAGRGLAGRRAASRKVRALLPRTRRSSECESAG